MGKGSIAIDRFTITALAAGGHVAPDRIRAKLDTVNAGALGAALARRVQGLGDADERLILIRRLDIGFAEGVASSGATLADELATRLAASLSRLDAVPAEHVVIFPDRTAFLAAFVRAVARGEVWDRWWFQRFEGLRFLPASTAIRTALEQDAGGGLAALLSLEEADRAAIVAALNPSDARRLLDSFSAIDGPPSRSPRPWPRWRTQRCPGRACPPTTWPSASSWRGRPAAAACPSRACRAPRP